MSDGLEGNAVGKAAKNLAGEGTGLDRAGPSSDRKWPIAYPNDEWLQKSYEQNREDAEWYEQWLGQMGLVKRSARRVFRFIVGWFGAWHLILVGLITGIGYDFSETAAEYAAGVSLVLLVASWAYIFRHEDEWDRYDFVRNAAIRRRVEAKHERTSGPIR